jgi:hypothetical protein
MASKTQEGRAPSKPGTPPASVPAEDGDDPLVLPMQKTSPTTYLAIGIGVVIIGGLVAFFSGGSEKPAPAAPTPAAQAQTMTKEEAKEREAHLRNTQAALEAVATDTPKPAAKPTPAEEPTPAASEPPAAPAKVAAQTPAAGKSKAAPAPKPVDTGKSKKRAADLDALGADITSQLK